MKYKLLQPEQIIAPSKIDIIYENVLKIYHRVCGVKQEHILPCVLVASTKLSNQKNLEGCCNLEGSPNLKELDNSYWLLDGNHRGLASTLCHRPIHAFELESDDDLRELKEKVEKGWQFKLPSLRDRNYDSIQLSELISLKECDHLIMKDIIMNLKQMTDELVINGSLPSYMIDGYRLLNKRSKKK